LRTTDFFGGSINVLGDPIGTSDSKIIRHTVLIMEHNDGNRSIMMSFMGGLHHEEPQPEKFRTVRIKCDVCADNESRSNRDEFCFVVFSPSGSNNSPSPTIPPERIYVGCFSGCR
jgi:hypothetical protein